VRLNQAVATANGYLIAKSSGQTTHPLVRCGIWQGQLREHLTVAYNRSLLAISWNQPPLFVVKPYSKRGTPVCRPASKISCSVL